MALEQPFGMRSYLAISAAKELALLKKSLMGTQRASTPNQYRIFYWLIFSFKRGGPFPHDWHELKSWSGY
jgi:hypothetical protein